MFIVKNRKRIKYFLTLAFLSLFFVSFAYFNVKAAPRFKNVGGNSTSDKIGGGEGWVIYNFPRDNMFELQSNVDVDLQLEVSPLISAMNMKFIITSNSSVNMSISSEVFSNHFQNNSFQRNRFRYRNRWNMVLHIQVNSSIDKLEIFTDIGELNQVFQDDQWAINEQDEEWLLLDTASNQTEISSSLEIDTMDFYVTLFSPEKENDSIILIIIIVGVVILSLSITLSKSEYRQFIRNRLISEPQQKHRLNIEEVLENENRSKIIDTILENPGIHFNEILRETGLSPGNLVWHLDILESYKIIGKKNVGQYLVYFPYYDSNPMSKIDIKLAKSKVTLKILKLIEENPGNYANNFAKLLKLDHKTIKYHIDKLVEEGLVETKQSGRKKLLYPVLEGKEKYSKESTEK